MHIAKVGPFSWIQFYLTSPIESEPVAITIFKTSPITHINTPPCYLIPNSSLELLDMIAAASFFCSILSLIKNMQKTSSSLICILTRYIVLAHNLLHVCLSCSYFYNIRQYPTSGRKPYTFLKKRLKELSIFVVSLLL